MDKRSMKNYENIDEYIAQFPEEVQAALGRIRKIVKDLAPEAKEAISYGIPTFKLNGNLVHFAAYEHHIGLYPGAAAIEHFQKDLAPYKVSKGTVQFKIGIHIPFDLIERIVRYKIEMSKKRK